MGEKVKEVFVDRRRSCNVHNDGVCAMHNVEVQRQDSTDKTLNTIPGLQRSIAYMLGYAVLASLVLVGAFYYTQETRAESSKRDMQLRAAIVSVDKKTERKIDKLTEQVSALTTAMVKNEARHEALIERVGSMMDYMTLLIQTKHPETITMLQDPRGEQ